MAFSASRTACLRRPLSADGRAERAARQADTDARAEPRWALRTACAGQDLLVQNANLCTLDVKDTRATSDATSASAYCTRARYGWYSAGEDMVASNRGASSSRLALGSAGCPPLTAPLPLAPTPAPAATLLSPSPIPFLSARICLPLPTPAP